ncbi:hypothetical protein CYMTET_22043 [Cymbomonas tetramitiformis]|uniref:Uncharacterized protein n=1 Tax=Cymbomonas tetramitiformis TaxID=36881 RepID=A0AAE0G1M3_9CHLO|nr:hypothetical protein CYMTET_22043 [Cymbomonas tetramitiformis]
MDELKVHHDCQDTQLRKYQAGVDLYSLGGLSQRRALPGAEPFLPLDGIVPSEPLVLLAAPQSSAQPFVYLSFKVEPVDVGDKPSPITIFSSWPTLVDQLWTKTSAASLEAAKTSIKKWKERMSKLGEHGGSVLGTTSRACRMAAAFHGDPDRVYLARGAACGVGFPFSQVPENTFYTVATYVSKEHWLAMQAEILKEKKANNIVRVLMHWKVQGICAAGTVEKDGRSIDFFLGTLLSTDDGACTASISEDGIPVVQTKVDKIRRLGALGPPPRCLGPSWRALDLLAFSGQVVYGLSPCTRGIRPLPNCIASEDDVYSDLLSRCQVAEFKRRFKEDRQISVWIEDEQLDKIETLTAVLEVERYAHTTQSSYSTGARSFVSFCISGRSWGYLTDMLPAADDVLAKRIVFHSQWLTGQTIHRQEIHIRLKPLTHAVFVSIFRTLAKRAGLDPAGYTGHSFCWGGATAAFRVRDALIQIHEDWASECYKLHSTAS